MVFKRIPCYTEQNFSVPSFLTKKTIIQNHGLTNTGFNKFLILLNKNISFLIKFYHGFSEQDHIFKLQCFFATFKSLKSVELPMHVVVEI